MVSFERALVSSYGPSILTFPLSLRLSGILPLLCPSTPLFSHPPPVSPKFLHVILRVGGWPLDYEERRHWANCPQLVFVSRFPTYVILIHERHGQTDGQSDGRTRCDGKTAFCTSASPQHTTFFPTHLQFCTSAPRGRNCAYAATSYDIIT